MTDLLIVQRIDMGQQWARINYGSGMATTRYSAATTVFGFQIFARVGTVDLL